MAPYFLHWPYRQGSVLTHLSQMEYDHILGADLGDGDVLLYLYSKLPTAQGDRWDLKRLILDSDDNHKIPAYLSYAWDTPCIGHAAKGDPHLLKQFKASPLHWEDQIDLTHSKRDVMADFLRVLWRQALQLNLELQQALDSQRLLLCAGCPASRDWTMPDSVAAYRKLFQEATGLEHVSILPESTAAIMTVLLSGGYREDRLLRRLDYDSICILRPGLLETSAQLLYSADSQWKGQALLLDSQGALRQRTCLHYGAQTLIGTDALSHFPVHRNFWVPPSHWHRRTPEGLSFRQLMADYISTLWKQLLAQNPMLQSQMSSGKLLLALPHSGGKAWNQPDVQKAWTELFFQATGCSNIRILPAAELDAAVRGRIPQPISEGIATFDAGSSTLDFTYIWMGQILICASLPLGGRKLNELIRDQALADSHMTLQDIPADQRQSVLVKIQDLKESYYTGRCLPRKEAIAIWIPGEQAPRNLILDLNRDFMRKVLWKRPFALTTGGPKKSWGQHCLDFLAHTKVLLGSRPCSRVILTGGTGHVTDLQKLLMGQFGPDRVSLADNPSNTVAQGLCYAKYLECQALPQLRQQQEALEKTHWPKAFLPFWDALAQALLPLICQAVTETAKQYAAAGEEILFSDFLEDISQKIQASFPQLQEGSLQETFQKLCQQGFDATAKAVDQISQWVYRINTPTLPPIAPPETELTMDRFSVASVLEEPLSQILPSLFPNLTGLFLLILLESFAFLLPAGGLILMAAPLFSAVGFLEKAVTDYLKNHNATLSPAQLQQLLSYLEKEKNRRAIFKKVRKVLLQQKSGPLAPLYNHYRETMEVYLELSLGRILFLTTEQEPQIL